MKKILLPSVLFLNVCFAQTKNKQPLASVQQATLSLTEVMYHDVINPPAAARFYAYSLLTGYEILSIIDSSAENFQQKLSEYPAMNSVGRPPKVDKQFATLYGILETGKNIIPSGYLLQEKQDALINEFRKRKVSKAIIDSSIAFAKMVSGFIVGYSKGDGYFKLSTLARYKPLENDSSWKPTPPEYMAAVEPHWQTIRRFFIGKNSIAIIPATAFSDNHSSPFFSLIQDVYTTVNQLSKEQKEVADFWDCNPFAVQYQGHMSIGLKKISPGGHWMGITGIACSKAGLDFNKTMLLHTLIALTLHDAFICCWEEKYRTNRIRPETAVNRYIDEKWKPYLQTPPFPEYVSGHSVISTAAAGVLTWFLGNGFSFTDTTENYIGLPSRNFSSFYDAAAEARISRLYGGIHFRDAIENGAVEGKQIGEIILNKLQMKPMR